MMLYMMPLTFSFDAAQKDVPYIYYTINPNNLQMCRKTVIIAEEKILPKHPTEAYGTAHL